MSALPTGRCQFRLLDQAQTCGCQRFRIPRSAAADEDEEECRCGHDACFHKLETTPPTSFVVPNKPAEETEPAKRLTQSMDGFAASRGVSGFSSISGMSTERDTSTCATPQATFLKPAFPPAPKLPPTRTTTVATAAAAAERANALQVMERVASVGAGRGRAGSTVSAVSTKSDITSVKGTLKTLIDATKELRNDAISHSDRLETIENLPSALEELAEKLETLDDRIDERYYSFEAKLENQLEARFAEVDTYMRRQSERKRRRKADERVESSSVNSDPKRRMRHESEIGVTTRRTTTTSFTTSTSTSFSTPGPVQSKDDELTALKFQFEQMKNRLTDVEASGAPTAMRPWDIEVVLIPPSSHVRGAWTDAGSSAVSTQVGSELGPSAGTAIVSNSSPPLRSGVLPRSFSVNSKTYRRLYSRGFVRRIHITGPTALEVSLAIESAFNHLFNWCQSMSSSSQHSSGYKGSRSSSSSSLDSQRTVRPPVRGPGWIPLRKMYKQTVLEYLPKSDLTTPALWTVDYLKVNCMMRSTSRRVIYILPTARTSMTWEDIHRLDRYHDQDAVQENSIEDSESCWEFDFKLDKKLPAPNDSFFSQPFANFAAEESLNNRSSQGSTPRQRLIGPVPPPPQDEFPPRDEPTQRDDSPPRHDVPTPPDTASANPQLRPRKRNKLNSKPAAPAPSKPRPTSRATSRARSTPPNRTTSPNPRPLSPPSTLPATVAPRRRLRSYKSPPLPPLQEDQKSASTTQQDSSLPVFEDQGGYGGTSSMREGKEERQDEAALMALFQSMEQEDREEEEEEEEESAGSSVQAGVSPAPVLVPQTSGLTAKGDSGDGGYISD